MVKRYFRCCLLVVLLVASLAGFSATGYAATSVTANFSVHNGTGYANNFGGAINQLDSPADVDTLRSIGINFARRDAYLVQIVPNTTVADYKNNVGNVADPSTWNWSAYDWVDTYHNKGIKTMLIMSYNIPWLSHSNTMHGVPKDWGVYQDIIKKIYTHFKDKVDYVEIWNEPDLNSFLDRTNSGYANNLTAYKDIYYYAANAIRSVDSSVPIGGPATASANATNWADSLLSDSRISNNINFLSYHYYRQNPDGEPQATAWRNVAAAHGKPDMPIFVTEWNYDASYTKIPMNNESVDAIPYLAQRLSDFINARVNGNGYFAFNKGTPGTDDFFSLYSDGSLTPKMTVYRLMSKQLGLGDGDFALKGLSWMNGSAAVLGGAAINSSGNPVAWIVNTSGNGDNTNVSFSGLIPGKQYRADLYEASRWQFASAVRESFIFTATSGSGSINFWLPYKCAVGIKLTPIN
ncbi:hypothetical protein GCM10010911_70440 [Paenibacillus nasutitermitis]|uniref:Glycosyl hydrolases family 39 N-terminal catalytic domain-containing protein n=2 Tax=Paenibacillus nasutitermitis TaxID=1652958 RepID=A0A916ZKD7_9BACL|nr:hypothetical protein GCM10010911_70440 [Paenibacillus nasutitermitis]